MTSHHLNDDVKLNDVIVFQGWNGSGTKILVIHRVVGFEDEGIITKGDNNNQIDQPLNQDYVTESNFQGIYQSKITFLKPIADVMTSSKGMIFAGLAVVLVVMLISEVIHLVKTYQEDQNKALQIKHENELKLIKERQKKEILEEIQEENK